MRSFTICTLHNIRVEPLAPIEKEAGWDPEPVWTQWWREKFPAPAGTRTLDHLTRSSALYHWDNPAPKINTVGKESIWIHMGSTRRFKPEFILLLTHVRKAAYFDVLNRQNRKECLFISSRYGRIHSQLALQGLKRESYNPNRHGALYHIPFNESLFCNPTAAYAITFSSVSMVTRLWTGRLGFDPPQEQGTFRFATASRPALVPIQPLIKWVLGILSRE
jgi:hypothetical protein